jgi:hypothetical protein
MDYIINQKLVYSLSAQNSRCPLWDACPMHSPPPTNTWKFTQLFISQSFLKFSIFLTLLISSSGSKYCTARFTYEGPLPGSNTWLPSHKGAPRWHRADPWLLPWQLPILLLAQHPSACMVWYTKPADFSHFLCLLNSLESFRPAVFSAEESRGRNASRDAASLFLSLREKNFFC